MKDYFISYNKADRALALAIKAWVEDAGFTSVAQATDFHPGSNFIIEMDKALKECRRTIALLSPDYLNASFPQSEWAATFAKDPTGAERLLVTVRVRECNPDGLLAQVVYVDLVGLSLEEMEKTLIAGLRQKETEQPKAARARASKRTHPPTKLNATSPADSAPSSVTMHATGKRNFQAAGNLIVTEKHVTKSPPVVPQSHHITDGQAKTILELLKELGERDGAAGRGNTYGLWQAKFKERPWAGRDAEGITSYKLVAADEFEAAVTWIKQQKARGRPSLRRTQNPRWRNEHYGKIWKCAKKLGWSHDEVHRFAQEHLKISKPIESLTELGERNLKKVAGAIYRRSKKQASH